MKKIININLSGRVVPIEDSAYEKLQEYIESLRRYFANEEGRDEIINDIESRIAELMSEKVRKGADSITDADVIEIANSMGRPEDFEGEEIKEQSSTFSSSSNTSQQTAYSEPLPKAKRRLYRDTSDKFLGGVCSGVAAYLNVDPAIVRILFAIIVFGTWFLGLMAYVIMWIALPARDVEGYTGKRLFRNPEGRILGGVCSGLAAYFNKGAATVRFIFLAPIILNILFGALDGFGGRVVFPNIVFGSLTGTFIIAYIVLWIVLPEARSPYEKMEMRGEKVDVNTIKQNVQERAKEFGDEVKSAAQNFSVKAKEFAETKGKTFAAEVRQSAKPVGSRIGHAIGVLFKVFFLFIAGFIALALFGVLMAAIFGGVAWWPINNYLWSTSWQPVYAWGTLILFLGVPLIAFLVWLIRRIIGVRTRSSYLGWLFGGLWTLGWICMILLVTSMARDVRYPAETQPIQIPVTQTINKLTVMVSEPELEFTERFWWVDSDIRGWSLGEDTMKIAWIDLEIKQSTDADYHIQLIKKSNGRSQKDALERAEKIQYTITSRDSVLDLGNGYAIDKNSKFRWQIVKIIVHVPLGKKIRFDESFTRKLEVVKIKVRERRGFDIDVDNWFRYSTDVDYIMTANGLESPDQPGSKSNSSGETSDYRYDNKQSLKDSIDAREKRLEEDRRRLEDDKKRLQQDSINGNSKKESLDHNKDGDLTGSPVFSLIHIFN